MQETCPVFKPHVLRCQQPEYGLEGIHKCSVFIAILLIKERDEDLHLKRFFCVCLRSLRAHFTGRWSRIWSSFVTSLRSNHEVYFFTSLSSNRAIMKLLMWTLDAREKRVQAFVEEGKQPNFKMS